MRLPPFIFTSLQYRAGWSEPGGTQGIGQPDGSVQHAKAKQVPGKCPLGTGLEAASLHAKWARSTLPCSARPAGRPPY